MHQTKHILLFFFTALMLTSCFKSYVPDITPSDANKLVVSGTVTDFNGDQKVYISRGIPLNDDKQKPVPGCNVTISNDQGHQFPMTDSSGGNYYAWIDPQYLTPGSSFKIEIVTPDGTKVVSDFDRINSCPPVDSVYFIRKDIPTSDPTKFVKGIQFYVDLNGNATDSRLYRWEVFETWEYHAQYPIEWYYDGLRVRHVVPPDYSKDTCWLTLLVRNIYATSTEHLAENKYPMFPLNFVDNTTARLVYGYSLLVKQYALSEAAYKYWTLLRINSTEQGGLYERQPVAAKGNLHNLTHPDQDVLGFFGASSVKSKRIFVKDVENLELEYLPTCLIEGFRLGGWPDYASVPKPIYILGDFNGYKPFTLTTDCVDCRALWGKNVKPDFWPY